MASAAPCIRCKSHTFFNCPFVVKVWECVPLRNAVHIAADASFKDAIVKFRSATCPPPTGYALNLLPWICWAIWIARNSLIFEDRVFSPEETYLKGLRLAKDNLQKQAASPSVNQELRIPREQSHSKRMQQRKEPTRSPA